jgi:hypothetical protein
MLIDGGVFVLGIAGATPERSRGEAEMVVPSLWCGISFEKRPSESAKSSGATGTKVLRKCAVLQWWTI